MGWFKMAKFISNTKNQYAINSKTEKKVCVNGQFVSKSNPEIVHAFRNNTASITGRKVTFKHV